MHGYRMTDLQKAMSGKLDESPRRFQVRVVTERPYRPTVERPEWINKADAAEAIHKSIAAGDPVVKGEDLGLLDRGVMRAAVYERLALGGSEPLLKSVDRHGADHPGTAHKVLSGMGWKGQANGKGSLVYSHPDKTHTITVHGEGHSLQGFHDVRQKNGLHQRERNRNIHLVAKSNAADPVRAAYGSYMAEQRPGSPDLKKAAAELDEMVARLK